MKKKSPTKTPVTPLKSKRDAQLKATLDSLGLIDPFGFIKSFKAFFSKSHRYPSPEKPKKFIKVHLKAILIIMLVSILGLSVYLFWGLPDPANLTRHPAPASTKILDRHGNLIYEVFADQRRTPIQLSTLPKYVINAHLAAEDKDFYKHSGISVRGIFRAFINTFLKQKLQDGSTITQQLVKHALLADLSRTPQRKIREFVLSIAVEFKYSKDQILEFYLNQVPYGGTAYGLESAAQTYFDKSAKDLSIAEASLLAGLPQAPSFYSPFGSYPERAKSRQKYVLTQMLENKFITQEEYDTALNQPLNYSQKITLKAPHFSLWVKDLLIQKYGLQTVEENGLTVTTTLDLELQNFAQDAIASEVAKLTREKVGNGASLVTHPKTGEVLAMVGSKDYFDIAKDGNVNVVLAHRQPGSSIKPINYAIAIDRKLITAGSLLSDKPTCFNSPNQKSYCPANYDGQFHGPTHARFALANSFNIPAVKVLSVNGLSDFVASASAFGITTFTDPKNYGPSLTLGGGEVTMLDMATAYGVLSNSGQRVDINPILQVTDRNNQVLSQVNLQEIDSEAASKANPLDLVTISSKNYLVNTPANIRVISQGASFITSHILYDSGARSATFGSGLNVSGHPEVSVKTGTTNDLRDNWTIGYNPDLLVAVWVGNNDNTPMSRIASGITGASPIWKKIITQGLKNYPQNWPTQPSEVTGTTICSVSGLRAPENPDPSCPTRYEYFITGTFPPYQTDNLRRDIPIFRPTQAPASTKQISDQSQDIEMQNHAVVFDTLGTMMCLDCPGGYGEPDIIRLNDLGAIIRN
jgi:penicillin-binding protein 1C